MGRTGCRQGRREWPQALVGRDLYELGPDIRANGLGDLEAEIDNVARGLARVVPIGIGLGVDAVADPKHAAVTDPFQGARKGGLTGDHEGYGQRKQS